MYKRKSRLSSRDQSRLIEHFVVGTTARAASEVTGVNVKTATKFFMRLRQLIASKQPSYSLSGEVEADESYFGGVRKGKRGRGSSGKIAVFGLLKRGGKVYTAIIPNAKTETLLPINPPLNCYGPILQPISVFSPIWDMIFYMFPIARRVIVFYHMPVFMHYHII